jgi:hypothetical protein
VATAHKKIAVSVKGFPAESRHRHEVSKRWQAVHARVCGRSSSTPFKITLRLEPSSMCSSMFCWMVRANPPHDAQHKQFLHVQTALKTEALNLAVNFMRRDTRTAPGSYTRRVNQWAIQHHAAAMISEAAPKTHTKTPTTFLSRY